MLLYPEYWEAEISKWAEKVRINSGFSTFLGAELHADSKSGVKSSKF